MTVRLLIVETSGLISELARKALAPAEWRVATEDDPKRALYGISAVTPDVVACAGDLGLMSGAEFARAVREIPVAARLPVLIVGECEAGEEAFYLAGTDDPKAFGMALYDAMAEFSTAEEEMAEAIELEEAFADTGEGLPEAVEHPTEESDILDLSEAAVGLELLESIELPEDDGAEVVETGEFPEDFAALAVCEVAPPVEMVAAVVALDLEPPLPECVPAGEAEADVTQDDFVAAASVAEVEEPHAEEDGTVEDAERPAPVEVEAADGLTLSDSAREAVSLAVADAVARTLTPELLSSLISATVEKVVWEVVPPLAEKLILEAIEKLKNPPEAV